MGNNDSARGAESGTVARGATANGAYLHVAGEADEIISVEPCHDASDGRRDR